MYMQDFIHYAAATWLADCLIAVHWVHLLQMDWWRSSNLLSAPAAGCKQTGEVFDTHQHSNSFIFRKHFILIRVIIYDAHPWNSGKAGIHPGWDANQSHGSMKHQISISATWNAWHGYVKALYSTACGHDGCCYCKLGLFLKSKPFLVEWTNLVIMFKR